MGSKEVISDLMAPRKDTKALAMMIGAWLPRTDLDNGQATTVMGSAVGSVGFAPPPPPPPPPPPDTVCVAFSCSLAGIVGLALSSAVAVFVVFGDSDWEPDADCEAA
jgi:hypothetical protein